jgi:hypothetical protein
MSFKVGDRVRGFDLFDGTIVDQVSNGVWGVQWDDESRRPSLHSINVLKLIESKPSMPTYSGNLGSYNSPYIRSVYK